MKRSRKMKFNVPVLEEWLSKNKPGAYRKLSKATGYSIPAIEKLRKSGHIPRVENLQLLAEAIGVPVDQLILFEAA